MPNRRALTRGSGFRQEPDSPEAGNPVERVAGYGGTSRRAFGPQAGRRAERRRAESVQAGARRVSTCSKKIEYTQGANRLRFVELLGRARREVLRFSGLLDQPFRCPARQARVRAG